MDADALQRAQNSIRREGSRNNDGKNIQHQLTTDDDKVSNTVREKIYRYFMSVLVLEIAC